MALSGIYISKSSNAVFYYHDMCECAKNFHLLLFKLVHNILNMSTDVIIAFRKLRLKPDAQT